MNITSILNWLRPCIKRKSQFSIEYAKLIKSLLISNFIRDILKDIRASGGSQPYFFFGRCANLIIFM